MPRYDLAYGAKLRAGSSRMGARDEIGNRTQRTLGTQSEHLRRQSRHTPAIARERRIGSVEAVEERPHRRQWLRIVARRLRMTDPDAYEEAAREVALE
jgi:hypothetical protein